MRWGNLLEQAPIPIWEEDFSAVRRRFDELRSEGVADLDGHLRAHPEEVARLAGLVRILEMSRSTLEVFRAGTAAELPKALPAYFDEESLAVFARELGALWRGETVFEAEIPIRGLAGERRFLDLRLSVLPGSERTLDRVLVSFLDVTDRKVAEERLRESEERLREREAFLRNVIDTTPSMVFVKDWEGRFVLGNVALARCYGSPTFEGLAGKTDADFNSNAEEVAHFQRDDREVMSTRQQKLIPEEPVTFADGQTRWFSTVKVPLVDSDGTCDKLLGVATDVTDRKLAEEARRGGEEKLRAFFENINESVVVYRAVRDARGALADWRVADANARTRRFLEPRYRRMGRLGREESIVGKRLSDLSGPERTDWLTARWLGVLGGEPASYEQRFGRRAFLVTAFRVADDVVATTALDVTARKRADEALREQLALKDQFGKVALSVPGLICSFQLRPDGTACMPFTAADSADVFGFPSAVLARDFAPAMANRHPEDARRVDAAIAESARTMAPFHAEFRYLHPAKGPRWLEVWSRPKQEPDGSILWHGYVMDVTERKRAEEALREADRLKTEFLGVLSHELRNPLAPIRNCIHLLDRVPPGGEQAARAKEVMRRQTDHLTRLVDDLLDVTRISRGKVELRRARIDLREVVARTCDDHRTLFEGRRIDLRLEIASPAWIDADATRIAQIVGNLLQNAAKFSHEGGTVTVAVGTAEGKAELRVRDDGTGIPRDLLPRIFEPFVQAQEGLARTRGGLGLGLALVKGLAELHGGTVRASSGGPGTGSELVVALPLAAPLPAPPPAPARQRPVRPLDVLVIEDNVDAAQTIADVLRFEGHRVSIATDASSGIAKALELGPEVILCDIGLPDMDGYEVARRLRAEPSLRSTRLIALSGYAQPEDRRRSEEAGFDAHVGKPASLDELNELIAGRYLARGCR